MNAIGSKYAIKLQIWKFEEGTVLLYFFPLIPLYFEVCVIKCIELILVLTFTHSVIPNTEIKCLKRWYLYFNFLILASFCGSLIVTESGSWVTPSFWTK